MMTQKATFFTVFFLSSFFFQAMVYMDDDVLGWQPLAEAWLNERVSSLERKVRLLDKSIITYLFTGYFPHRPSWFTNNV